MSKVDTIIKGGFVGAFIGILLNGWLGAVLGASIVAISLIMYYIKQSGILSQRRKSNNIRKKEV